jgi:replication factor C subunit 3/5
MNSLKYFPKNINDLSFGNKKLLFNITKDPNKFISTLIYGKSGTGKRTRAYCILNELHGSSIFNINIERKEIKKKMVYYKYSTFHVEINPALYGNIDINILKELIELNVSMSFIQARCRYFIYIINNVDKLTDSAFNFLKTMIRKPNSNIRFILISNNTKEINSKLMSSLFLYRHICPSKSDIYNITEDLCKKNNRELSEEQFNEIFESIEDKYSLKKFLYIFDLSFRKDNVYFKYDQIWFKYINDIVDIIKYTTIDNFDDKLICEIRSIIIKILLSSFNSKYIIKYINKYLIENDLYKDKIYDIILCSSKYEKRLLSTGKDILHLEAYVYNLIDILNS